MAGGRSAESSPEWLPSFDAYSSVPAWPRLEYFYAEGMAVVVEHGIVAVRAVSSPMAEVRRARSCPPVCLISDFMSSAGELCKSGTPPVASAQQMEAAVDAVASAPVAGDAERCQTSESSVCESKTLPLQEQGEAVRQEQAQAAVDSSNLQREQDAWAPDASAPGAERQIQNAPEQEGRQPKGPDAEGRAECDCARQNESKVCAAPSVLADRQGGRPQGQRSTHAHPSALEPERELHALGEEIVQRQRLDVWGRASLLFEAFDGVHQNKAEVRESIECLVQLCGSSSPRPPENTGTDLARACGDMRAGQWHPQSPQLQQQQGWQQRQHQRRQTDTDIERIAAVSPDDWPQPCSPSFGRDASEAWFGNAIAASFVEAAQSMTKGVLGAAVAEEWGEDFMEQQQQWRTESDTGGWDERSEYWRLCASASQGLRGEPTRHPLQNGAPQRPSVAGASSAASSRSGATRRRNRQRLRSGMQVGPLPSPPASHPPQAVVASPSMRAPGPASQNGVRRRATHGGEIRGGAPPPQSGRRRGSTRRSTYDAAAPPMVAQALGQHLGVPGDGFDFAGTQVGRHSSSSTSTSRGAPAEVRREEVARPRPSTPAGVQGAAADVRHQVAPPALSAAPQAMWNAPAAAGYQQERQFQPAGEQQTAPLAAGPVQHVEFWPNTVVGIGEQQAVPSLGSFDHASGRCRPCVYFMYDRCFSGWLCNHCHVPHDELSWKRQRPPQNIRKQLKNSGVKLHHAARANRRREEEA